MPNAPRHRIRFTRIDHSWGIHRPLLTAPFGNTTSLAWPFFPGKGLFYGTRSAPIDNQTRSFPLRLLNSVQRRYQAPALIQQRHERSLHRTAHHSLKSQPPKKALGRSLHSDRDHRSVFKPTACSGLPSKTRSDVAGFRWSAKLKKGNIKALLEFFKHLDKTYKKETGRRKRFSTRLTLLGKDLEKDPGRTMHSHIQFVTVPTVDTPGTGLLLHFDTKRYFFGQVHEGMQRASLQHGSKLLKVREFFLTGKTDVQTTGGLLGMILTLAGAANASLEAMKEVQLARRDKALQRAKEEEMRMLQKSIPSTSKKSKPMPTMAIPPLIELEPEPVAIHGPPNIMHSIAAARNFIFRQGLPMDVDEFAESAEQTGPSLDWDPTWKDDFINVWTMPIVPLCEDGIGAGDHARSGDEQNLLRKRSHEDYVKGQRESFELQDLKADTKPSQEIQAQELRQRVVHEMFRSSWRPDKLIETKLADVKLPAKVFVRDPTTKKIKGHYAPLPDGGSPVPDMDVLVRLPWPGALVSSLPPAKASATALSYVVQTQEQRGKFVVQKAKDLKVPTGPLYSELSKGKSVTLADGRIITSDQVLEPAKPGGGVAIVDLPSRDYVASLVGRQEWSQEKVMRGVEAFIWLLGPGVAQDEQLAAFMNSFGHLRHVISTPDHCSNQLMMSSAASACVRHHLIDPDRYSLLQHHNTPRLEDTGNGSNRVVARPGLMLRLNPRSELDTREVQEPVNMVQNFDDIPSTVFELAAQARETIMAQSAHPTSLTEDQELLSPDAEIICLGTGSAQPSLHRNVSGTLLRMPGSGSYLFDAGENTLGQLKRIYSPAELSEVLQDLKMIWISHLHADHHLGTIPVIKAWYHEVHGGCSEQLDPDLSTKDGKVKVRDVLNERFLVVASGSQMLQWLKEYSSVEDFGFDHVVPLRLGAVSSKQNTNWWDQAEIFHRRTPTEKSNVRAALGLQNLQICHVTHCHDAMAISVTFPNGFKFSYSGDCRPSDTFAAIGRNSTVLVHEATFDDEMIGDAMAKKHSTMSEAAGVGMKMGAKRVILTHFSQRYQKIPTMSDLDGSTVRLESAEAEGNDEGSGDQMEAYEMPDTAMEPETTPKSRYEAKSQSKTTPVKISANKDMKIAVAFDYMRVKVKDIASLEHFTPALRELYKDEDVKMEADRSKQNSKTESARTPGKRGSTMAEASSGSQLGVADRGGKAAKGDSNETNNGKRGEGNSIWRSPSAERKVNASGDGEEITWGATMETAMKRQ